MVRQSGHGSLLLRLGSLIHLYSRDIYTLSPFSHSFFLPSSFLSISSHLSPIPIKQNFFSFITPSFLYLIPDCFSFSFPPCSSLPSLPFSFPLVTYSSCYLHLLLTHPLPRPPRSPFPFPFATLSPPPFYLSLPSPSTPPSPPLLLVLQLQLLLVYYYYLQPFYIFHSFFSSST